VWRASARDLVRNRVAVAAAAVLVVIVLACLLAPVYASDVAHVNAFDSNLSGTTIVNGKRVPVLAANHAGLGLGVTPIGPTWDLRHYFLGSDSQGRDVFARVLYGGRTSLLIGSAAAAICCLLAALLGLAAGYFGGPIDWVVSRVLDVIWAFPIYLLAISLSVVLLTSGINVGFIHINGGSLWLPILIIALVFVPYVARPIRGQVIALREREFILAAIGVGASDLRILRKDIVPNIAPSVVVFFPLMVALSMLAESALSFLSIGVQPPNASWGTIINDGLGLVYTRPAVAIAPGLMIAIAAISLNIFGDGVREVLDPRAKLRGSV
jgi:peptide/nickel transport system permease protein